MIGKGMGMGYLYPRWSTRCQLSSAKGENGLQSRLCIYESPKKLQVSIFELGNNIRSRGKWGREESSKMSEHDHHFMCLMNVSNVIICVTEGRGDYRGCMGLSKGGKEIPHQQLMLFI